MGINGQRKTQSARGDIVDFDMLMIKAQLAAAPQNVEVARRQEFIDSKEQGKTARKKPEAPVVPTEAPKATTTAADFENENGEPPVAVKKAEPVVPVPVIERPAAVVAKK